MRILDVDPLFEGETPYYVMLRGGNAFVKSGNGNTPIVASKIWDTMTPEIEAKAHSQGFRKITLSVNGAMIPALEGGGKVIVGKSDYGTIINSQNESSTNEGVWYSSATYDPDYKGPGQYNNEIEELEGLMAQTAFSSEEMQRRDMLMKKYGINGPEDYTKLQAIKDKELARIGGIQQSRIAAGDAADAKADAERERELALRAKYGHLAPQDSQQQGLQESKELDRIKYLSKVLRG
jgi:hypothetical protein